MVDLGFMNNSPMNIGKGIKNPFASSPSLVNNAPRQDLQKKIANPVASQVPNMSTVEWPKTGWIIPNMSSLNMFTKQIPSIPKLNIQSPWQSPLTSNLWVTPISGWIPNTNISWLPDTVKSDIANEQKPNFPENKPLIASIWDIPTTTEEPKKEIDYIQSTYDLAATINVNPNISDTELLAKFPEYKWQEQSLYDLAATIQNNPNITDEEISKKFAELWQKPREQKNLREKLTTTTDPLKDRKNKENAKNAIWSLAAIPKMVLNLMSTFVSPMQNNVDEMMNEIKKEHWIDIKPTTKEYLKTLWQKAEAEINKVTWADPKSQQYKMWEFIIESLPYVFVPELWWEAAWVKWAEIIASLAEKAPSIYKFITNPIVNKVIQRTISSVPASEFSSMLASWEWADVKQLWLWALTYNVLWGVWDVFATKWKNIPWTNIVPDNTIPSINNTTKVIKPTYADKLLQKELWFSKAEIRQFRDKYWIEPGQYLNNKWMVKWWDETIDSTIAEFERLKTEKKNAIAEVKQTLPKNDDVTAMTKEVYQHEIKTASPTDLASKEKEFSNLVTKAENGELTHTELEQIKSNYERNKSLRYDQTKSSEEATRQKNLDSSVRTFQQKELDNAGFSNIKDINQEISKNKFIADKLVKKVDETSWLWLADYVILAEWAINPSVLPIFVGKKIAQTWWFKRWLIKALNKINGRVNVSEKIADIQTIKQISSDVEFENWLKQWQLKTPALPKATPWVVNPEWINYSKDITPITVTPEWSAVRKWQILETNKTTNVNNSTNNTNSNILQPEGIKPIIKANPFKKTNDVSITQPKIVVKWDNIETQAIKKYWITKNPNDVLYITSNGQWMNWGKWRTIEHADVALDILNQKNKNIVSSDSIKEYMKKTNNIRIAEDAQWNSLAIEIITKPNDMQLNSIAKLIKGKEIGYLDINKNNKTLSFVFKDMKELKDIINNNF